MNHYTINSYVLPVETRVDICMTKDNEPCRLPFIYNGVAHYNCISEYDYPTPWCATEINSTNHMLKHRWGDCASVCSVEEGNNFRFEFA